MFRERETYVSRRGLIAGATAATLAIAPAMPATATDPIFAAIAGHKAARRVVDSFVTGGDEAREDRFAELCDAELAVFVETVSTVPTTLAGAIALAEYTLAYPDIGSLPADEGLAQATASIATALRSLTKTGAARV